MNVAPPPIAAPAAPAMPRRKNRIFLWPVMVLAAVFVILVVAIFYPGSRISFNIAYTLGQVRSIEEALMNFKIQHGFTPTEAQGLEVLVTKPDDPRVKDWKPLVKSTALVDTWQNKYKFRNPGTRSRKSFDLFSLGPDGIESVDDIGNW